MNTNTNIFLLFLLLITISACQPSQPDGKSLDAMITQVEQGLTGPVYIEGDPTWTMEERMAHYGVPGLSIAVIKDFNIHWTKSYGVVKTGSDESVTDQTLFQAASPKSMTNAHQ